MICYKYNGLVKETNELDGFLQRVSRIVNECKRKHPNNKKLFIQSVRIKALNISDEETFLKVYW